jgi:glycosyltransferase involved in cell wall biosynthesis
MRVLHVLPTRVPEYGGPVRVAEALVAQINSRGHDARIFPSVPDAGSHVGGSAYWPGIRAIAELAREVATAHLVHIHGLWTVPSTIAGTLSRARRVPYVITPHGMLDRWCLRSSRWRKLIYAAVLERRNLNGAAALHFFSEEERAESHDFGLHAPSFVLPNGVDTVAFSNLPRREELWKHHPQTRDKIVVLFLGRIHPIKGLDMLIPAFARALALLKQLHLIVAGPDEGGYRSHIEVLVAREALADHVTFTGPVRGEEKRVLLGGVDVFALPSRHESDSVAVKEALASGLPVLITSACHFPEVASEDAGVMVAPEISAIVQGLARLAGDSKLRRKFSENARNLVKRRYQWKSIGERLLETYASIL